MTGQAPSCSLLPLPSWFRCVSIFYRASPYLLLLVPCSTPPMFPPQYKICWGRHPGLRLSPLQEPINSVVKPPQSPRFFTSCLCLAKTHRIGKVCHYTGLYLLCHWCQGWLRQGVDTDTATPHLVARQDHFLPSPVFPSRLLSLEAIVLLLAKCTNLY